MNNFNPLLGICIPTYKRPNQLKLAVKSIIHAARDHNICIILADDSTDETNSAVITELMRDYKFIQWHRNKVNLGIDGNILNAVNLCQCKYAWLLGEDDRIIPDAISRILKKISDASPNPAFICCNYSYVDEDFTMIIRESLLHTQTDCTLEAEQFVQTEAWAIGFIGACIINKSVWETVDQTRYIGTYFAHVGTILESIRHREVLLLSEPSVYNRVGGASVFTWSGDTYGVYKGWDTMMSLLNGVYPEQVCTAGAESFRISTGYGTLRFLSARRADNIYNMKVFRKDVLVNSKLSARYKLTALFIAILPQTVLQLARKNLNRQRKQRGRAIVDPGL